MQDSIEDYIKLIQNTKETKIDAEKRKEIILAAQKKKECEEYSLKIVEFLIEGQLRPEIFLKCLKHINQEIYQDIIEERAITKICGYPLCGRKLPSMPNKQYFISSKANKVYDITDRKNYCCNFCYKASLHIKQQIDTSPLWLRKNENELDFNLLPYKENDGLPGEQIVHGITKSDIDSNFTSVNSFAQCSLNAVQEMEVNTQRQLMEQRIVDKSKKYKMRLKNVREYDSIYEDDGEEDEEVTYEEVLNEEELDDEFDKLNLSGKEENVSKLDDKEQENNKSLQKKTNINKEILEYKKQISRVKVNNKVEETDSTKSELKDKLRLNDDARLKAVIEKCKVKNKNQKTVLYTDAVPIMSKTKPIDESPKNKEEEIELDDWLKIKQDIKEWISLDTLIFLHGIDKVKRYLDETKIRKYFDALKINERAVQQQLKYMDMCKRLQLREIADEKFDKMIKLNKLKPLPDYKKLKEEGKEMNLKVRSFYDGELHSKTERKQVTNDDENVLDIKTLAEQNRHNVLRRKVLVTSIQKMLFHHADHLKINRRQIIDDVKLLVKTFSLNANNVTFKANYFDIIVILLIKLLAFKSETLKKLLEEERNESYIKLILSKYPQSYDFIENIMYFVNDLDNFVKCYFSEDDLNNL